MEIESFQTGRHTHTHMHTRTDGQNSDLDILLANSDSRLFLEFNAIVFVKLSKVVYYIL